MSDKTIDNRVVELKFDNEQFEEGVATSQESLQNLNESIDESCENNTQAITDLSDTMGENSSGLAGTLEKISSKFSGLGIAGSTAIGMLTTQAISLAEEGLAKVFSGITKCTNALVEGGKTRAQNLQKAKYQLAGMGIAWSEVGDTIDHAVSGTAYSLDQAALATGQLMASGVEAGDELNDVLETISGVAAITDSSYEEIAQVFERVAGQGRMFATDLNSLSARGINVAAELAEYMGKTEAEVRDMVSDGEIGMDELTAGLKKYFEVAAGGNKTLSTAVTNFYTQFKKIGEKFWTPLVANIDEVNSATGEVYYGFVNLFNSGIEGVNNFKAAIDPMVTEWTEGWDMIIHTADNAIKTIFGEYTDDGTAQATEWMKNVAATFETLFSKINDGMSSVYGKGDLFEHLADGLETVTHLVLTLTERLDISGMVSSVLQIVSSLGNIGTSFIQNAAKAVDSLASKGSFDVIINNLKGTLDLIKTIASWLTPTEKSAEGLQKTLKGLVALVDILLAPIKIFKGVMTQLKGGLGSSEGLIADNLFNLTGDLSEFVIQIDEMVNKLVEDIIPTITKFINKAKEALSENGGIVSVLKSIYESFTSGTKDFSKGSEFLSDTFKSLMDGFGELSHSQKAIAGVSAATLFINAIFALYQKYQKATFTFKKYTTTDENGKTVAVGPIRGFIQGVTDLMGTARSAMNKWGREQDAKLIEAWCIGIAAVLAGLAAFVAQFVKLVNAIVDAYEQGNMNAVYAATGVIVVVIGALGALLAYIVKVSKSVVTDAEGVKGLINGFLGLARLIPLAAVIVAVAGALLVAVLAVTKLVNAIKDLNPDQIGMLIGTLITIVASLTLATAAIIGLGTLVAEIPFAWAGVLVAIAALAAVTLSLHVFINDIKELVEAVGEFATNMATASSDSEEVMTSFSDNWGRIINNFNSISWLDTIGALGKFATALIGFGTSCGLAWSLGLDKGDKVVSGLNSLLESLNALKGMNATALNTGVNTISSILSKLSTAIHNYGSDGEKKSTKKLKSVMENIAEAFNYISNVDFTNAKEVVKQVQSITRTIAGLADFDSTAAIDNLDESFAALTDTLHKISDTDLTSAVASITSGIEDLKDVFDGADELIEGADAIGIVVDAFNTFDDIEDPTNAGKNISEAIGSIKSAIMKLTNEDFKDKPDTFAKVMKKVGEALNNLDVSEGTTKKLTTLSTMDLSEFMNDIRLGVSHFSAPKLTDWADTFKDVVEKIKEPIEELADIKTKNLGKLDDVEFSKMCWQLKNGIEVLGSMADDDKTFDNFEEACQSAAVGLSWFSDLGDLSSISTLSNTDTSNLLNFARNIRSAMWVFSTDENSSTDWQSMGANFKSTIEYAGKGLKAWKDVDLTSINSLDSDGLKKFMRSIIDNMKLFKDDDGTLTDAATNFATIISKFSTGLSGFADVDEGIITTLTTSPGITTLASGLKAALLYFNNEDLVTYAETFSSCCVDIGTGLSSMASIDTSSLSEFAENGKIVTLAGAIKTICTYFNTETDVITAASNFMTAAQSVAAGMNSLGTIDTTSFEALTTTPGIVTLASGVKSAVAYFSGEDAASNAANMEAVCLSLKNALATLAGTGEDGSTTNYASFMDKISTAIGSFKTAINDLTDWNPADQIATLSAAINSLKTEFASMGDIDATSAANNISNAINKIKTALESASTIGDSASGLSSAISSALSSGVDSSAITSVGSSVGDGLASGITSSSTTVSNAAASVGKVVISSLKKNATYDKGKYIGGQVDKGLSAGLSGGLTSVCTVAYSVGAAAVAAVKAGATVASPAKAAIEAGMFIDMGLMLGMLNNAKTVYDAANTVGSETVGAIQNAIEESTAYVETEDLQPVIKPKLDLTEIEKGMKNVETMSKTEAISVQFDKKAQAEQATNEVATNETVNNYYFNQTNNSPEALDATTIYRNTKSILAYKRGVVG